MDENASKIAQLKRLRSMMRKIMAEEKSGIAEPAMASPETESTVRPNPGHDEEIMDMEDEIFEEEGASEDPVEDELTRMKRNYFRPKSRAQRPGTAVIMSVSSAPKKGPPVASAPSPQKTLEDVSRVDHDRQVTSRRQASRDDRCQ